METANIETINSIVRTTSGPTTIASVFTEVEVYGAATSHLEESLLYMSRVLLNRRNPPAAIGAAIPRFTKACPREFKSNDRPRTAGARA